MEKPTRYYFEVKRENKIYYLDENTGEFGSCAPNKKDLKYKYFHLFKGDEQSNDGLLTFQDKFAIWNKELENVKIYYKKYFNHYSAVEKTFYRYAKDDLENCNFSKFEEVSYDEFCFMESCYNAGIIYLNPDYKEQTVISFGYDYSSFYPNMLIHKDLKIPTKEGSKLKLASLDFNNLQFGIYKVLITCSNENFKKVFAFSKSSTYTHYSLQFANKYKNVFGVNIELKTDCEYNALIYKDEDLIESKKIFNNWFNKLYGLKSRCSKGNMLLKQLLSSLWGSLTKCEKRYFTDEQMESNQEEKEYKIIGENYYYVNGELNTVYECVKIAKPYKYTLARMKPFILSFSRNIVGDLVMNNGLLENVIRIATDGIVLNKEYNFTSCGYYPKPEEKTTGLIQWNNVNSYFKVSS